MPLDYVTKEGDIGNEVLFVKRGQVERLSDDTENAHVTDTYGPGTLIGEVNLLCSIPRQITLRAKSYVDLLTLSKGDMECALQHFPLIAEQIHTAAEQRFGHVMEAVHRLDRATVAL